MFTTIFSTQMGEYKCPNSTELNSQSIQQYSKQKHVKERTCQISHTENQVVMKLKMSFCHEACATGQ